MSWKASLERGWFHYGRNCRVTRCLTRPAVCKNFPRFGWRAVNGQVPGDEDVRGHRRCPGLFCRRTQAWAGDIVGDTPGRCFGNSAGRHLAQPLDAPGQPDRGWRPLLRACAGHFRGTGRSRCQRRRPWRGACRRAAPVPASGIRQAGHRPAPGAVPGQVPGTGTGHRPQRPPG
ncbi:hypothetical protein D3C77_424020 [compost metagenome]